MKTKNLPILSVQTAIHTALAEYPMNQVGTAFMLALYCARNCNGGLIKNCRTWTPRQWRSRTGIEHAVRQDIPGLLVWKGDDLAVLIYDAATEKQACRAKEHATRAAQTRWNEQNAETLQKQEKINSSEFEKPFSKNTFSKTDLQFFPKSGDADTPKISITPHVSKSNATLPASTEPMPGHTKNNENRMPVHMPGHTENCEKPMPGHTEKPCFPEKSIANSKTFSTITAELKREKRKEPKEKRENPPHYTKPKEKEINKEKESPAALPHLAEAAMSPPSYLPDTSAYPSLPKNAGEVMAYLRTIPTLAMDTDTLNACAESFFNTAEGRGWTDRYSAPIRNWHGIAREYARRWQVNTPYPTAEPTAARKAPAHTPQALQTPSPRRDTLTRYIPPADTPAAAMSPAVRESCRNFAAEIASLMADFTHQPQTDPPPLPDSPP